MIQRIQTIWLFLIAVISVVLIFNPGVEKENVQYASIVSTLMTVETALIAIFSLIALILYKNRSLQIKVCNGVLVLILLLVATMGALLALPMMHPSISDPHIIPETEITLNLTQTVTFPWLLFPVLLLVFIILAIKGIKNDEKLVRSADRLR